MSDQVEKDAQEIQREKNKAIMARVRAAKIQKRQAALESSVPVQEDEPKHEEFEAEEPPTKQSIEMAEKTPDDLDSARSPSENEPDPVGFDVIFPSITSALDFTKRTLVPSIIGVATIYSLYQLYKNFKDGVEVDPETGRSTPEPDPFEGVQEPVPDPPQEVKPEEVFKGNEFALPLLLSQ